MFIVMKNTAYIFILFISFSFIIHPISAISAPFIYPDLSQDNIRANYKKDYEDIIANFYAKARFPETIKELSKIYNNVPDDIKDKLMFTLAKSYYKTDNRTQCYRSFKNLIEQFPKSEQIVSGKISNSLYKIIQIEAKNSTTLDFTFLIKLYYLMIKTGSEPKLLKSAEQSISSRINDRIKISINLQNSRINDYDQFKYTVINDIWNAFFKSDMWLSEAIDLGKTVSLKQIDGSYNYFSKDLLVKVVIKDVYGAQSLRYIGYGMIETTARELLQSLNISINDFFNKTTDQYFYHDEL